MATLLVRGSAPPNPSICRGSGLPKAANIVRVLNSESEGRSESRKKRPLLVPPLIRVHETPISLIFFSAEAAFYLHSGPFELSPHFSHPVYCIGAMIRRAAPTAFRSVGLLSVPFSTLAVSSVAGGATHSGRPFRRFVTTKCEKFELSENQRSGQCGANHLTSQLRKGSKKPQHSRDRQRVSQREKEIRDRTRGACP